MNEQKNILNYLKQLKKNKTIRLSLNLLIIMGLVALFADFLANEKPLIAVYRDKIYFPIPVQYNGLQHADWKNLDVDFAVFPLIPYLPNNLDMNNSQSVSPFGKQHIKSLRWRHWLGTDELGRDVLAGLIHGTQTAFAVGFLSMTIAGLLGLLSGCLAGYFGDEQFKISRARLWLNVLFLFFAFFYGFITREYLLSDAASESLISFLIQIFFSVVIFTFIMLFANLLVIPLKRIPFLQKKIILPIDLIISRIMEIFVSIPTLFLILGFITIVKPSLFLVSIIIGFTFWTSIARFVRAELLRIRGLDYIESAKSLGLSHFQILWKHALPNAISPVLITLAFGMASAILAEATLSFLGIGLPADTVTWGSLLSAARKTPQAWWLAVFPGLAIFISVTVFNLLGERINEVIEPGRRK